MVERRPVKAMVPGSSPGRGARQVRVMKIKKILLAIIPIVLLSYYFFLRYEPKLNASAFLIYNDRSLSNFDVLNDKKLALRNTIIGEGDAVKPSKSLKLILSGSGKNLSLVVMNGNKTAIEENNLNIDGSMEYIIQNTGCEVVTVDIKKREKSIYSNSILFQCGE